MSEQEAHWVIVGDGTPQSFWVGKTTLTDDEICEAARKGDFILLDEARTLRTLLLPREDGALVQSNQVLPAGICRSAVPVRVKPVSYFWPEESPGTLRPLLEQLEKCSRAEMVSRAKDAGIEPAGGPLPSGHQS
jgi:hypothetical protein